MASLLLPQSALQEVRPPALELKKYLLEFPKQPAPVETISIVKKLSGHCLLYQRVSLTLPKALWVFRGFKNILCFSVIEEVSINIR